MVVVLVSLNVGCKIKQLCYIRSDVLYMVIVCVFARF